MTTDAALDQVKRDLRTRMKAVRRQAFERHGAVAGQQVAAHGIAFAGQDAPAWVSVFLSIGEEIDTAPLIERLRRDGFGVALPVMLGKGRPLQFRAWSPGDPLDEVQWGIKEPLPSAEAVEPDVVISPLLAWDESGYRLGYGGGFYDRSLEQLAAKKPVVSIGLAFDEQKVDAVPRGAYDQRLDWMLTPSGVRQFCGT
jgi:5-formyltetrahydrofolate cyclo-ligase